MLNPENIKLIIWDLDDTIWHGILSEEQIQPDGDICRLIRLTADCGIVHSVVSKNDFETAQNALIKLGLWDLFVFSSINWEPKGERIKRIIDDMRLRSENVLFVDDNVLNLEEAAFYCDGIMTAFPDEAKSLLSWAESAEKADTAHSRLSQYRLLEEKTKQKKEYSDNTEFLRSSEIKVEIFTDCNSEIERILELVSRTNQLNYTKLRQSREELEVLLDSSAKTGYVKASDKFGDYGIIGFFAVENGRAVHFLFSCRTLGMGIEQWVWAELGYPEIEVNGEVAAPLTKGEVPDWINKSSGNNAEEKNEINTKVLFKGPCDLQQIFSFIKENDNIKTEFTYVNESGTSIEGTSHTAQFLTALTADEKDKKQLCDEFGWFDDNMLETALEAEHFEAVFYSVLADSNLGVYRRKGTELQIALCQKCDDLTNEDNFPALIAGKAFTSNIRFTQDDLKRFSEKYDCVDSVSTTDNLERIYSLTADKVGKWVILLGSEKEFPNVKNPNYINRHIVHKVLNDEIKKWAQTKSNVEIINLTDYIASENDYVDSINHFTKKVYYELAKDIADLAGGNVIETKGRGALIYRTVRQKGRQIINRLRS